MDKREYRYHTIVIDKEEQAEAIIESLRNVLEAEEYTEEWTEEKESMISNVLYAVNYSLTGGNGDSFYYPEFKDHVRFISALFPEIEFTAGWTNQVDEADTDEFTFKNGVVVGDQEIDKAEQFLNTVYKKAKAEHDRLEKEFEIAYKKDMESEESYILQDAILVYSKILNGLR